MKKIFMLVMSGGLLFASCSDDFQAVDLVPEDTSAAIFNPLDPLDPLDPLLPAPEPPRVTSYATYLYPGETLRLTAQSDYPEATFGWYAAGFAVTPLDAKSSVVDITFPRTGTFYINCTASVWQQIGGPEPPVLGTSGITQYIVKVVSDKVSNEVWLENKYEGEDFYLRLVAKHPVYAPHPDQEHGLLRLVYLNGGMRLVKLDQAGRIGEQDILFTFYINSGDTASEWRYYASRVVGYFYDDDDMDFLTTTDPMYNYEFKGFRYKRPDSYENPGVD